MRTAVMRTAKEGSPSAANRPILCERATEWSGALVVLCGPGFSDLQVLSGVEKGRAGQAIADLGDWEGNNG